MKFPLLYSMFLTFVTCLGQSSQTDLKPYFSESQIMDLNLIADFFQSELCGDKDHAKYGKCMKDLVPKITDLEDNFIEKNISYRKQKRLYRTISKSTFEKIWAICKGTRLNEPVYKYESLCFSGNQKFTDFVLELGKTSGYLINYGQTLQSGLGNGNYIANNIIDFPLSMNIEDRGVQIIFAIHYLTLNDNLKRDKKLTRLSKRDLRKLNRTAKKTVPNKTYN
ncbi:hypothetical protein [Maribacter sp. 2308TA10-17]|uniref:hypothetical protein n=1 Tax=Maribacter sp. 2308TA10-17 TaxID=3386276 RepID=UPI0039BD2A3D